MLYVPYVPLTQEQRLALVRERYQARPRPLSMMAEVARDKMRAQAKLERIRAETRANALRYALANPAARVIAA